MIRHGQVLHNVDYTSTTNEKSKLTENGKNKWKMILPTSTSHLDC